MFESAVYGPPTLITAPSVIDWEFEGRGLAKSLQKPLNDKAWFVAEEENASVLTPSLSFLDGNTSSNCSDSECRRKMAKQIT